MSISQSELYDKLEQELCRFRIIVRETRVFQRHCDTCPVHKCPGRPRNILYCTEDLSERRSTDSKPGDA